jgi:hypothetical protein
LPKADFVAALAEAAKYNKLTFHDDKALEKWREESYLTVKAMLKVVKKNMNRRKPPKWITKIFPEGDATGDDAEGASEQDAEEEEEEETDDGKEKAETKKGKNGRGASEGAAATASEGAKVEYVFDYDEQKGLACRRPRGSRRTVPWEFCSKITPPQGDDHGDQDSMIAAWPDGVTHPIAQLTVGQWKAFWKRARRLPTAKSNTATAKAKTKTHPQQDITYKKEFDDGRVVDVALKWNNYKGKPKQRLCCLRDSHNGQVFQIDVKHFGATKEIREKLELEGHELEVAENEALRWFGRVGKMYADGTLDKNGCLEEKANFMLTIAPAKPMPARPKKMPKLAAAAPKEADIETGAAESDEKTPKEVDEEASKEPRRVVEKTLQQVEKKKKNVQEATSSTAATAPAPTAAAVPHKARPAERPMPVTPTGVTRPRSPSSRHKNAAKRTRVSPPPDSSSTDLD